VEASDDELRAISVQLTDRVPRRFVGEELLADVPGLDDPAAGVDRAERVAEAVRIQRALTAALAALGAEDRLILKYRFCQDLQVSQIARLLKLDQKALYRRLEQTMKVLRRELEVRGVDRGRIEGLTGEATVEISRVMGAGAADSHARPSSR
jgi:RNA polymerase sigma factor (sigma-70 family)